VADGKDAEAGGLEGVDGDAAAGAVDADDVAVAVPIADPELEGPPQPASKTAIKMAVRRIGISAVPPAKRPHHPQQPQSA
jgi:hypothetical protein